MKQLGMCVRSGLDMAQPSAGSQARLITRVVVLGMAAVAAAPSNAVSVHTPTGLPAGLQQQLDSLLRGSQVRGGAAVLVDISGPVAVAGFGTSDVAVGTPFTGATCARVGELANTFTSVLALRLAEQDKLDLERPLPPDLQPLSPAACAGQVSVAQLLEQTAGLMDSTSTPSTPSTPSAGPPTRALSWCPGLHYRASPHSIALAAKAIERAGGANFTTLMQREVFEPLGLRQTRYSGTDTVACPSKSHAASGAELAFEAKSQSKLGQLFAAELTSTPLELAKLVQMLLRYGDGEQGNVLEACSVAHMSSGSTGLASRLGLSAGIEGRGLTRFVAAGRLMLGYTGQAQGFRTLIGLAPETGRGMVLVLNTADEHALTKIKDVLASWVWQNAPPGPLPRLGRTSEGIAGWYVKPARTDGVPAQWAAVRDLVRVEPSAHGAQLRSLWPWVAPRQVVAVTEHSFRSDALPLAGMAFARLPDGSRWWIDAESFAEITPWRALLTLAAPVLACLVTVLLAAAWLRQRGFRWRHRVP